MNPAWIVPSMFAAAAACFAAAWLCSRPAHGAEQTRWEIVIFQAPLANEPPDQPRIYVISEAYADKDTCLQMLRSVRIKAPKAKAKCLPKED